MSKAIMFLADGFEECEGLIVVDLLRRANIEVITASIMDEKGAPAKYEKIDGKWTAESEKREIAGAHGIHIKADNIASAVDFSKADAFILPGGMPGTKYLNESELVKGECASFPGILAAICAAPSVLSGLGLLDGKKATAYPSFKPVIKEGGAKVSPKGVQVDGRIITGEALGSAIPFALEIIKALSGETKAREVRDSIVYNYKQSIL